MVRDAVISIRIPAHVKEAAQNLADAKGCKLSAWVGDLVSGQVAKLAKEPPTPSAAEAPQT